MQAVTLGLLCFTVLSLERRDLSDRLGIVVTLFLSMAAVQASAAWPIVPAFCSLLDGLAGMQPEMHSVCTALHSAPAAVAYNSAVTAAAASPPADAAAAALGSRHFVFIATCCRLNGCLPLCFPQFVIQEGQPASSYILPTQVGYVDFLHCKNTFLMLMGGHAGMCCWRAEQAHIQMPARPALSSVQQAALATYLLLGLIAAESIVVSRQYSCALCRLFKPGLE